MNKRAATVSPEDEEVKGPEVAPEEQTQGEGTCVWGSERKINVEMYENKLVHNFLEIIPQQPPPPLNDGEERRR